MLTLTFKVLVTKISLIAVYYWILGHFLNSPMVMVLVTIGYLVLWGHLLVRIFLR